MSNKKRQSIDSRLRSLHTHSLTSLYLPHSTFRFVLASSTFFSKSHKILSGSNLRCTARIYCTSKTRDRFRDSSWIELVDLWGTGRRSSRTKSSMSKRLNLENRLVDKCATDTKLTLRLHASVTKTARARMPNRRRSLIFLLIC